MIRATRARVARAVVGACLIVGPTALADENTAGTEATMERIRIEVGELTFDALAAGPADGELVLLLHGFPQTSHSFRAQIPVLARMGYRVVAPDQRGYSKDARPDGFRNYAMGAIVGDTLGMATALGHERFHVIGHDWGAAVAWVVAGAVPQRVISLVALSTPHPTAFSSGLANPESEQARRSSYMDRFAQEGAERWFLADDAAVFRGVFQGSGMSADEIQFYVDALGDEATMKAALAWYRALKSGGSAPPSGGGGGGGGGAATVTVPTLYVWSTEDMAFSRQAAEASAKYVTGPYRYEVLEGISHWVPEQAADRVNALLVEHFEGLKETG